MSSKKQKQTNSEISDKYQKLEHKEHVLTRPGMYIGAIEEDTYDTWVMNRETNKMEKKQLKYIPGLFKIFDEILVNAIDHSVRLKSMKTIDDNVNLMKSIKVSINQQDGVIEVINDGDGIEVVEHPEHKIYIPELIFGNLLTSTNYDDSVERVIGGCNGLGSKAANIFSEWFEVETVDRVRKLIYKQRFETNMSVVLKPTISKYSKKPYTSIKFKPDLAKFKIQSLSDEMMDMFVKRVYDVCAVTDNDISVYLNDTKLEYKNFEKYVDLYIGSKDEHTRVYEKINDRWEIVASYNDFNGFDQISFVNGVWTIRGGKHVEYILNQIVKKLSEMILKKNKNANIKPQNIRDNIILFVRSTIVNPSFDSQSKETLTTPISKFGSKAEVSDKFIEKLYKTGIAEKVMEICEMNNNKDLKKTDGKKRSVIKGIPKLDDANWAGTNKSKECTLILTEGDSAKTMVLAGISQVGRDRYGVFPLKGKVMNVKDTNVKKITDNEEISNLKKILGLETGKEYKSLDDLRYGRIMLMCDSDCDGFHIKALLFNLFQTLWPSLFKTDKFLTTLLTPIVKASNNQDKKNTISFYCNSDYENWKKEQEENGTLKKWRIKYYKGLGTSTNEEAKQYFKDLKIVTYEYTKDESDFCIDLAFNKKKADERKDWLSNYNRNNVLDYNAEVVKFEDFINKELIHFSNYDIERSIPNLMDGLKISQRKILFACYKRNLVSDEIRVAQLASYVSEHACYHHGEASLQSAIIAMAQNFEGANNINLLKPNGQFGCLAPDTKILMWDGSAKEAKDVIVGDVLVGDDGKQRNVLRTTMGIDDMYEVQLRNGDTYTVNSEHILTLKYSNNKSIFWRPSDKSYRIEYFDTNAMKSKVKTVRTIESTTGNHYNSSKLSKEEAFKVISDFKKTITFPDVFDIKLNDYLQLPKSVKEDLLSVKNSTCIEWSQQPTCLDPYILGIWLGDGNSDGTGITSMDEEILREYTLFLDMISCELIHDINGKETKSSEYRNEGDIHENYHFTTRRKGSGFKTSIGDMNHSPNVCNGCQTSGKKHSICDWKFNKQPANEDLYIGVASNGMRRTDLNPWKELLKKNNLFNNKHIPKEFIVNDKKVRLELLAGLIDTDGCVKYQDGIPMIEITQSKRLRKDIIMSIKVLCNSLGYQTSLYETGKQRTTTKGESASSLAVLIRGDKLDEIPTRVPRKRITYSREMKKCSHHMCFSVNHVGKGEFYGWSIDGNERFLLNDFTITHNSRVQGGKDAGAPRYIYTLLEKITQVMFNKQDNGVLTYLNDDGIGVEPEYYVPVIPLILVNGAIGIGTGFSTNIPCYNPIDIIAIIKNLLTDTDIEFEELVPWYMGFGGTIENNNDKYVSRGCFKKLTSTKVEITELPVGTWTEDFKMLLEEMVDKDLKSYESQCTDKKVLFTLQFTSSDVLDTYMSIASNGYTKLENDFKLVSSKNLGTTNMYLYNHKCQIQKYNTALDIILEFYQVRLSYYTKRKNYVIDQLEKDMEVMRNKIRFIRAVVSEEVKVSELKKAELEMYLTNNDYLLVNDCYDYLLKIPIYNITKDKVSEIEDEYKKAEQSLNDIKAKTEKQMWLDELELFEKEYLKFKEEYYYKHNDIDSDNTKTSTNKKMKTSKKQL
jgi:DNA gyrase/topoisomerase IV subunit B